MTDLDPARIMADWDAGRHRECVTGGTYTWCLWCAGEWPCLPQRLAAEVIRLTEALATAEAKVAQLSETLLEAAIDVADYAQYAGRYLREKWNVDEDVARYRALAGEDQ